MASFWRAVLFVVTVVVILGGTVVAIFYARGYRVNLGDKTIGKTGLLVATSVPDGAQVWVNGELRSATNATVALAPGEYTVELRKEGLSTWKKKINLKAEEVVKTDAVLFPTLPNLRPMTFTGVVNPTLTSLGDRLVYGTPLTEQSVSTPSARPVTAGSPSASASPGAIPIGLPTNTAVAGQSGIQSRALANQLPTRSGLWILDLVDMPLGFSREPKQIVRSTTILDWSKALTFWSPDERQILAVFLNKPSSLSQSISLSSTKIEGVKNFKLSDLRSAYLLDSSRLNNQSELVDISSDLPALASQWASERKQAALSQISKLPVPIKNMLISSVSEFKFSPDETKILYQATASATLPNDILLPLPGSNSQPQQRTLHSGGVYVYDLKEDRNFWIEDLPVSPTPAKGAIELGRTVLFDGMSVISWFPTSRHLIKIEPNKITILEYDNTNPVVTYAGSFVDAFVYPYPSGSKLIILTDLGGAIANYNLYALIFR